MLPEAVHVVVVTHDPAQTCAVLGFAAGAVRSGWLLDSPYSLFDHRLRTGASVSVASVEIGQGRASALAEVGRLSLLHPDALLLVLDTAGSGDSVVASGSASLVAVARRLARSASGRVVVEPPADAPDLCSYGRMQHLVLRGHAEAQPADVAFAVVDEQVRLLALERDGLADGSPVLGTAPTDGPDRSMAQEATAWVDAVTAEPPMADRDDGAVGEALARSDFFAAGSLFFYELVYEVVTRIDDLSRTWSGRRLRSYARECARAMASVCDTAPVARGSPADMAVRFPVVEMLERNAAGAAVMLTTPAAWRCLDATTRDRVLTALCGPGDAPRPPSEVGWSCLLPLVEVGAFCPAEHKRMARVVACSSYDLLTLVRAPLSLALAKVLTDLGSGVPARQDLAARFLYRDAPALPGQLTGREDYAVGGPLHSAARAGSHGAAEALSRTNLAGTSVARRAGVLMAALFIDGRYLRLDLPAGERAVLAATSLTGDLAQVLEAGAGMLPSPVGAGELSGYLVHETADRLTELGDALAPDEAELWAGFVATLRARL